MRSNISPSISLPKILSIILLVKFIFIYLIIKYPTNLHNNISDKHLEFASFACEFEVFAECRVNIDTCTVANQAKKVANMAYMSKSTHENICFADTRLRLYKTKRTPLIPSKLGTRCSSCFYIFMLTYQLSTIFSARITPLAYLQVSSPDRLRYKRR